MIYTAIRATYKKTYNQLMIFLQQAYTIKNSSVIKNLLLHSCGSLIVRIITLITIPITMSLFSPTDFGLVSLGYSFMSIMNAALGLGLRQALAIDYFSAKTLHNRKQLINNTLLIYLFISVPLLITLVLHTHIINSFFFANNASELLIWLILIISYVNFFIDLLYQVLHYQLQTITVTYIQILTTCISMICTLLFLLYLPFGPISVFIGTAIGSSITVMWGLILYFQKNMHLHLSPYTTLKNIGYYVTKSVPFIPHMLFNWVLGSSNRWLLAHTTTLHNVGIYSLADTFANIFYLLIIIPMTSVYVPHMLQRFNTESETTIIERHNRTYMITSMIGSIIFISISFILAKPLLYFMLPQRYHEAIIYILFLILGYIFYLGSCFASIILQFKKCSYFLGLSLTIPAITNCMIAYLLIPHFQIYGCVLATVVSYTIYFIITLWYNSVIFKKML